ncbi:hypothetical protein FTO68_10880 [Methanocalculus taiwanensis]|uniref:Metallophosphoesterase n=1 Tax=Methanocalculus taiwanensis TaxID=106207 RepID=A0ABD4TQB3_9EURY|nr:hypothetical protein [Methanocalculus taiwanensis]MCQ1539480.1 hypothetical protein [Methanocalculus taiwanensis]
MIIESAQLHTADEHCAYSSEHTNELYRIDLRLGIPHAKLPGALEWWGGDSGLCRRSTQHPYLVGAVISGDEWSDLKDIMNAVSYASRKSGQIQVSVFEKPVEHEDNEVSFYLFHPNPGLRSFFYHLSLTTQIRPVESTFVNAIASGIPATLTTVPPLPPETDKRKDLRRNKRIKAEITETRKTSADIYSRYRHDRQDKPVRIDILRMVLRQGMNTVAEYDIPQERWLNPLQAVQRTVARRSLREYRIQRGYQITKPRFQNGDEIYVMSDLHLEHANSIPRYKRPFLQSDPGEMNRILIRNWNWTVKQTDTVFYLGDLAYMSANPADFYLNQLNGKICFLEGNHDPYQPFMSHCLLMRYREIPYLFIHDPEELVRPFNGWIIHGHVHNKDLARYPFFNPESKTINVSAEMIGYHPISMREIDSLVRTMDENMTFREMMQVHRQSNLDPQEQLRYSYSRGNHVSQT